MADEPVAAHRAEQRGQVLVIFAVLLVVLLAFAGIAIDLGRQIAERRHAQTAADAGALAACRALIAGESDSSAALTGMQVALVNLEGSPAGAVGEVALPTAPVYADGHIGDPDYLTSGVLISGTTVRLAIYSELETALAKLVGISTLETGARARCQTQSGPTIPIVARRYLNSPGPGNGFVDNLASVATSTSGEVDSLNVLGYDGRTPASEAEPGPPIALYGPDSKAGNQSAFRGFVALDVRNFQSETSRVYYNGVYAGITENTLKDMQGAYLLTGYPGPMFPSVVQPADPNDQVAALLGNDTAMVVGNFDDVFAVGDRLLLAVYDGTVMEIPDFSISPPGGITLPSTTSSPVTGPNFTVTRNQAFSSTVTLHLHGDLNAVAAGFPAYDILPVPPLTPPLPGDMDQPTWSTDVFIPSLQGTRVTMQSISTNTVPAGIYTVWLEGHSGNPYFQTRRVPVPVLIGGATRDFSLANSTVSGSAPNLGDSLSIPIYVSTTNAASTKWGATGSAVSVSYDAASFTDCLLGSATIPPGQITFSSASVTPTSVGLGALSTMTINTSGLAAGCYRFDVRAHGTNGDGQPVTHLQPFIFNVATTTSSGSYVDIIGFAVFEVTALDSNQISGQAVTGVYADSNDPNLRRAQRARLIPWS